MSFITPLSDRAVLAVSGEDARTYLQGIITNDINKVTPDSAIFSALLSPQGKYLFEFFILEHEGKLLLETDKARLPELIKRLTMYRLRAKVTFEETTWQVAAAWGNTSVKSDASQIAFKDPRHAHMGQRILYKALAYVGMDDGDYEAHRLSLGIPEGGKDLIIDRSILLEFGYDHLNAIDFTKGCYVGQEVTARSKHRATLHKYIHCVASDAALPPAGTVITSNGRELGDMRSSRGSIGLAVLRTEDAALTPQLEAGNISIRAQLPSWIAS